MFQHPNKLFNKFFIWEKSSFFSKIVLARVHFNGQVRLCIIYHNPSGIFSPEKFIFKKLLFSPFLRQKLSVFHLSKTKAKNNNYLPSRQQQIIDWRHFLVSWLQKRYCCLELASLLKRTEHEKQFLILTIVKSKIYVVTFAIRNWNGDKLFCEKVMIWR